MCTQTRDISSVHYNSMKHKCDVSHMLCGAIMNLNRPITAHAISQTFYEKGDVMWEAQPGIMLHKNTLKQKEVQSCQGALPS